MFRNTSQQTKPFTESPSQSTTTPTKSKGESSFSPSSTLGSSSPSSGLVRVAVHEQVSALYDGVTDEPTCHVEGSIYVQPTEDLQAKTFLLVIRDADGHVAHWKDWSSTCQNVTDSVPRKGGMHRSDRVLRITTKSPEEQRSPDVLVPEDTLVAQYICTDRVRPVPMVSPSFLVWCGVSIRMARSFGVQDISHHICTCVCVCETTT